MHALRTAAAKGAAVCPQSDGGQFAGANLTQIRSYMVRDHGTPKYIIFKRSIPTENHGIGLKMRSKKINLLHEWINTFFIACGPARQRGAASPTRPEDREYHEKRIMKRSSKRIMKRKVVSALFIWGQPLHRSLSPPPRPRTPIPFSVCKTLKEEIYQEAIKLRDIFVNE